ncbi:MAG: RHS repeat-associated core domain-containing protein [Phycisphaerales bacterium]|nr:RHS repeat-associated core domain-containing protein [Phycisphaerales bacterium]
MPIAQEQCTCQCRDIPNRERRATAGRSGQRRTASPGSEAEDMTRVEFRYDYLGRRVEKAVFEREAGSPGSWEQLSRRRFVYDGWNLIEELNLPTSGDPTVLRQYTWGFDLGGQSGNATAGSGNSSASSLHGAGGAGGIGGLLSVYDTNGTTTGENATSDDKSYVFLYDANGNVGQLVEWADGAGGSTDMAWSAGRLAAKYEYDPYGNIVGPDADGDGNIAEESGPYAAVNPFRFSTKYLDSETGLYYYGYRYYSPRLGRWISRDPIGEYGGPGLKTFIANDPLNRLDAIGLQASQPTTQPSCKECGDCCSNWCKQHPDKFAATLCDGTSSGGVCVLLCGQRG